MKSFNSKLVISAVGVALLATPALAQRPHRHFTPPQAQSELRDAWPGQANANTGFATYPNPVVHSGSALSHDMGNDTIGGID